MTLDDRPNHPANRAYVLKFRRDSAPERGVWAGRVEHVDSGRRHDFDSLEALLAWLAADPRPADRSAAPSRLVSVRGPVPDRSPTDR